MVLDRLVASQKQVPPQFLFVQNLARSQEPFFNCHCVFSIFRFPHLKHKLKSPESSIVLYMSNTFFKIIVLMQEKITQFNSHAKWRSLFSCFFDVSCWTSVGVHFSRKTVQLEYQSVNAFFGSFWLPAGHPGSIDFARRFPSKVGFRCPFFVSFVFLRKSSFFTCYVNTSWGKPCFPSFSLPRRTGRGHRIYLAISLQSRSGATPADVSEPGGLTGTQMTPAETTFNLLPQDLVINLYFCFLCFPSYFCMCVLVLCCTFLVVGLFFLS